MIPAELTEIGRLIEATLQTRVSIQHSPGGTGEGLRILLADVHPQEAFVTTTFLGLSSVRVEAIPGAYARSLLAAMAESSEAERTRLWGILGLCKARGAEVSLSVNSGSLEPEDAWPAQWDDFRFVLRKEKLEFADRSSMVAAVSEWSGLAMLAVLSLCQEDDFAAEPEGAEILVHRKYERSRVNRALALQYHGCVCCVCEINFEAVYGPIGRKYIQLHHLLPLSAQKQVRVPDIKTEFAPVCANCHAMIHRTSPPISPEQLRRYMDDARALRPDSC